MSETENDAGCIHGKTAVGATYVCHGGATAVNFAKTTCPREGSDTGHLVLLPFRKPRNTSLHAASRDSVLFHSSAAAGHQTRSRDSTACLKSYTFSCGCLQASQVQHDEMGDPEKNMTPAGQGLLRTARLYLACLATATNRAKAPMHLVNAILLLCSVLRSVYTDHTVVRQERQKTQENPSGYVPGRQSTQRAPSIAPLTRPARRLVRQGRPTHTHNAGKVSTVSSWALSLRYGCTEGTAMSQSCSLVCRMLVLFLRQGNRSCNPTHRQH